MLAALILLLSPASARAEGSASGCAVVTRANVASCAVAASASVAAEREGVAAAGGRRAAAAPWFPSNPTLSFRGGRRAADSEGRGPVFNYYASLSQEIDVSGQRGSRRSAADAEVAARTSDVVATKRRVAAHAYAAYFDALAARDALEVAKRLEATGADVAKATRARAEAGVGSKLDAEITDAAALRLVQSRIHAEREQRVALATLTTLLGRDPTQPPAIASGDLEPLGGSDALAASANLRIVQERPEVKALEHEQRAHASRAQALRRAVFPTLTLSIYAENDGYNERVLGAGLALPLPLPQPVGRTYVGEAAESEALARQAGALSLQLTRDLSNALANAAAAYEAARAEAALFTPERITRTERIIADMAAEVEAGRLAVRDAVLAQQQLMDVLRARVEARHGLAIASVELSLAAGAPLEGAR
ncbi:MAG: TolC family protein [Labilithrix sp.]|nr:TolC family protein [Labilithrix sp.]